MHAYHVVAVSPSDAGDVGEAWGALERLLDGAAAERVVLAECVVQSGHSRIESRALREHGKGVAALEEGHLDDVGLDRAVGMGGVEAAEPDHIRIELGEGDDRIEVVVERAGGFAPAAADAVFKVLFAFDGVLRETHERVGAGLGRNPQGVRVWVNMAGTVKFCRGRPRQSEYPHGVREHTDAVWISELCWVGWLL